MREEPFDDNGDGTLEDDCEDVEELLARDDAVVECVPNVSEGRDAQVVEAVAAAARSVPGCSVLDVAPGADTNRTVYTLAGKPSAVLEAARALAAAAKELVDMRTHRGAHPRLGALDVCPLVPVRGLSLRHCGILARELARRIAEELDVPVFLYGAAVDQGEQLDYRRTAPLIRAGEYEGLAEKLRDPRWKPDFGPCEERPRFGACLVGARPFLLAYNVNILGTKEQAHRIALAIRTTGRPHEGRLKHVQGMGWWLPERRIAQVSMNLSAPEETPLHVAFEAVCKEARALQVAVAGSELVGLAPLGALLAAGRFYARRDRLLVLEDEQLLALATARLGLSQLAPFDPRERVLELRLGLHDAPGPLAAASMRSLLRQIGDRTASPGGGSASAVTAALGAALGRMVAQLTYGKRAFEAVDEEIRRLLPPIHRAARALEIAADRDADAFQMFLDASRLPSGNPAADAARDAAKQRALAASAAAPARVLRDVSALGAAFRALALVCSPAAACDLRVAAELLPAAARGCAHNVDANASSMDDSTAAMGARRDAWRMVEEIAKDAQMLLRALDERKETQVEPLVS